MNLKKIIETIKELKKTARGKALLFFAGYLIFFIIIIIVFRVSKKMPINNYSYDGGRKHNFSFSEIENNNYKYNYKIVIDENTYLLTGQRYEDTEMFTVNNKEFYKVNDNYFTLDNGLWIKSNNPNNFSYFTEIENIQKLIEQAYYLSKTDYESGKEVYNFLISTNNIEKIYRNQNIDIADEAGEIIISTNEDLEVEEVKLKLNSFCKFEGSCKNNLEITLSYDSFGDILEIESPIS